MLEPTKINGEISKSLSSEENEKAKIDAMNELPGNLKGDDCPLCKNRGYIAYFDTEDCTIRNRKCSCMAKREALRILEQSGLSDSLERCTFESYSTPKEWQRRAKALAERFVANPDGWFIATGGVGSGKTHLCTAICEKLIKSGVPTRYMQWRSDAPRLKALVNDREDYEAMINPFKRIQCLYIDDFFKTAKSVNLRTGREEVVQPTEGDINLAFEILNERYNNAKLITIISSEKSISEILGIDEAVGSRIYERSKNFLLEISGGNNWRLK